MTHQHIHGRMYRMPYGFGPSCGPRQGPDGQPFSWTEAHRFSVAASYLTDRGQLEALLPPGFDLAGEPIVTVEFHVLSNLEWLAGRGYSMLQVRFPARYRGKKDTAVGSFLSVLWENLADPILSGREELGFAKLWCDLPPPRRIKETVACTASWLSHTFAELAVDQLVDASARVPAYPGLYNEPSDGTLHYKYFPETEEWGRAALAHACLTPAGGAVCVERVRYGRGRVRFLPTTWDEMPTQFHIVSALAALPVLEDREGWTVEARGGSDLSNQRRLL